MGILCESAWFPCPGAVKTAICDGAVGGLCEGIEVREGGGLVEEGWMLGVSVKVVLGIHQCCTKAGDAGD